MLGQCNEILKDKLQILQNRDARVICNRQFEDVGDHQELLNQLGWLNVRQHFSLELGLFVFKAKNGVIPDQFNEMYSKSNTIHSHGTRAAVSLLKELICQLDKSQYQCQAQNFGMKYPLILEIHSH